MRLKIQFYYIVTLVCVIVGVVLFAVLYKGGGMPLEQTAGTDAATPTPSLPMGGAQPSPAPTVQLGQLLFPFKQDGKWGYKDEFGQVKLSPLYATATPFEGDYATASVLTNGQERYGVLARSGEWSVEPVYADATVVSDERVCVKVDDTWGVITVTGEVVLEPVYSNISAYSDGMAVIRKSGKYGYIDQSGNVVIDCEYASAGPYAEGLAFVMRKDGDKERNYIIDKGGEIVQALDTVTGEAFSNGLAVVNNSGAYGYVDTRGERVIKTEFEAARAYADGLAPVKRADQWGFVDRTGAFVIELQYADAQPFAEGLAAVKDASGNWGYIDREGSVVIAHEYKQAQPFENGYALVDKAVECGVVDKAGNYKRLYVSG